MLMVIKSKFTENYTKQLIFKFSFASSLAINNLIHWSSPSTKSWGINTCLLLWAMSSLIPYGWHQSILDGNEYKYLQKVTPRIPLQHGYGHTYIHECKQIFTLHWTTDEWLIFLSEILSACDRQWEWMYIIIYMHMSAISYP